MNYNFEHGLAGMYRGKKIYIIKANELKALKAYKEQPANVLFAVSTGIDNDLTLCDRDVPIGWLTKEGIVHLYCDEVEEEAPTAPAVPTPAALAANDINLDALGFQVDDYLKRMDSQIIYKDLMRDFDN